MFNKTPFESALQFYGQFWLKNKMPFQKESYCNNKLAPNVKKTRVAILHIYSDETYEKDLNPIDKNYEIPSREY